MKERINEDWLMCLAFIAGFIPLYIWAIDDTLTWTVWGGICAIVVCRSAYIRFKNLNAEHPELFMDLNNSIDRLNADIKDGKLW